MHLSEYWKMLQAPDGNASLSALQLPQNLVFLSHDVLLGGRPLQGSSGCEGLLSYHSTLADNILYVRGVNIVNIWSLNLIDI